MVRRKDWKGLRRTNSLKKLSLVRAGYVSKSDLVRFFAMHMHFLMPSLYEGFGLPLVEAMACGCPVITSESGITAGSCG